MKTRLICMAAVTVLGAMPMAALAGEEIDVIETDLWGPGSSGGPFEVKPSGFTNVVHGLGLHGASTGNFVTFCVETNEFLSEGGHYYVELSKEARAGGSGGPDPDPLDSRTAYLYANFIRGTLQSQLSAWLADGGTGGTWTDEDNASGTALQKAIWFIEEETGGSDTGLAGKLVSLAAWAVGGGTGASVSEIGKVHVMNMWTNSNHTGNAQDLLVMIPLPAPVWMGGLGLCGVVGMAIRRRRAGVESSDYLVG